MILAQRVALDEQHHLRRLLGAGAALPHRRRAPEGERAGLLGAGGWGLIDPEETLRHFIYLDRYDKGADPYAAIPMSLASAERKFGKTVVRANGTLPWVIENRYNALVKAFRAKNGTQIWTAAARLGPGE